MATSRRDATGGLARWWGVLAGALLITAWINPAVGPTVIIALSAAVWLWAFFQAPVSCGAPVRGREDGCRNNAYGLALGCHIRQHRWQKLKLLIVRRRFREFWSGLFSDAKATVVTLAGLGSFLSGVAAFITVFRT